MTVIAGIAVTEIAIAAAVGLAGALALALLVYCSRIPDRGLLRWALPIVALLPAAQLLAGRWRPTQVEQDVIVGGALVAYGPAVVTVAALVFGLSRPFARSRGVGRLARHPVFWIAAPYVPATIIIGMLVGLGGPVQALTPGPDTTVTKTLSTQLDAAGRVLAGVTTTGDQIGLSAGTPSATTPLVVGSAIPTAGAGAGAHTLQGPGRVFLLVRGNALTTTAYYDGADATFSATAGPTIPTPVGAGGFSLPRGDGTFLLVVGGNSKNVYVVDPGTGTISSWTVALPTPTFTLQGATGAGAGAHAIKRSDGRFVIVHGAGNAGGASPFTTLYTPPGTFATTATTSVAAGAATVTPVAMGSIRTGDRLTVDTGGAQETVTVTATTASTFTATFANAHGPGAYAIAIAESASAGPATTYASTAFTTSSTTTVAAGAGRVVTPTAMGATAVGDRLVVDSGAAQETITVTAVTATTFTATFANAHGPAAWPISTSSVTAVTAGAARVVTPRSMAGIVVGSVLVADTGAVQEQVRVTAVTATTFTATFANAHGAASWPIVIAAAVGDGALSIPLTGANAGKWTTFIGQLRTNSAVYDPTPNTFSATSVTAAPTALGAGATAIQYTDGTLGVRWVILNGNGTKTYFKYDPAGALSQTLASLTNAGNPVFTSGTHAFKRADGTFLVVGGASTTTRIWTPGAGVTGAFTANGPALTLAPGPGAHTFQQTDGQMTIVLANTTTRTTTNVHDAGWTGSYTSEMINPNVVDFWDQLGWTTSGPLPGANSLRISVRTGTDATLPTPAGVTTYQDFFPDGSGGGSGTAAITTTTAPQGKRFVQVRVTITRPSAPSPDAETGVWLGSGSLAYDRVAASTTSSLSVSTTSTTTVAVGTATVTPASMVGIVVGSRLLVDTAAAQETVVVTATAATTFTAVFTKAHGPASWAITTAPVSPGSVQVAPASMAGIAVGSVLAVDSGVLLETVTVTTVTATTFTATFANAHGPASWQISGAPVLRDYSLRFKRAYFYTSVPATATAGVAFAASITLKDSATPQNTITEYAGTHTIFFGGANAAPDGTVPIVTSGATSQPFGGNTAVPFTAGASPAGATLTLYKAETALPTGNETFTSASTAYFLCDGALACGAQGSIAVTAVATSVVVSPTAVNAAQSTTVVAPATLTVGGTATITTTVRDNYRNPIPAVIVAYSSSRGATDTITPPPGGTDANGEQLAQATSSTIGTAIISVTAAGTPLQSVTVSWTAAPGAAANVTLVKDDATRLGAPGITTTNTEVTGGGLVQLKAAANPAAATFCSTPLPCGAVTLVATGVGGHTLQGSGGQYLTFNGNNGNTASLYDGVGTFTSQRTFRDAATASLNLGAGAHSFLLPAGSQSGKFLTVRGGGSSGTMYVDPAFPVLAIAPPGPSLSGAAGAGAFAVSTTGGRFLIVHGGGSAATSIYQTTTDTIAAGPALSGAIGAGAFGLTRSDGTVLLVHGGGTNATTIFTPASTSAAAGPAIVAGVAAPVGAGGHAAQLSTSSWLIVTGGATLKTVKFDTTASNPAPFTAGLNLTVAAGLGAHTMQRADGKLLIVHGGGVTSTTLYTPPTPGPEAAGAGPATSAAVGDGAHAFQQIDHRHVVVLGNNTTATNRYDAGWIGTGTFATEYLTRTDLDSWNKVAWAVAGTGAITVQVEVAASDLGAGAGAPLFATPLDAFSAANPSTTTSPQTQKFARGVIRFTRAVPAASGAQAQVWLGSSSIAPIRTEPASPTLSSLSLGYRTGLFSMTGPATAIAGTGITVTATLKDLANVTLTTHTGAHTLVFDGASDSPAAACAGPAVCKPTANGLAFGAPGTSLTFASGAASTAVVLYAAETAAVGSTETIAAQSLPTFRIATGYSLQPTRVTIVVSAGNPDAAQSTFTALPSSVPSDDVTTSALTLTVRDQYGNLAPGSPLHGVGLVSNGGQDTITPASGTLTSPGAAFLATIRSPQTRTSVVTATITFGASSIVKTVSVTFTAAAGATLSLTLTPLDASGTPIVGPTVAAGQTFGMRIEVAKSTGGLDLNFCDGTGGRTCAFTWSTNAGVSADNTAPTIPTGTTTGVIFSGGVFTTSLNAFRLVCANSGVVCLSEASLPAPVPTVTLSAQQASNLEIVNGSTVAIGVTSGATDAAKSFVLLSPSAAGVAGQVGVPTQISVWARVVDAFGNAGVGRAVSLTTSRAGVDTLTAGALTGDVYGYTAAATLSSTAAGVSQLTATVAGSPITVQSATFFSAPRLNNGTYYGTVSEGTPSKIPLGAVATNASNMPLIAQSGALLVSGAEVCWTNTLTAGAAGAYDATGVATGAGCVVTTTSGATRSVDQSAPGRSTAFQASQPGSVVLTATAGSASFSYTFTVASYVDITSTASPSGRVVRSRVDWDGTDLRVVGWQSGP